MKKRTFGFIATTSRASDVFFHMSALEDCTPEQLQEGTAVTFVLAPAPDLPAASPAQGSTPETEASDPDTTKGTASTDARSQGSGEGHGQGTGSHRQGQEQGQGHGPTGRRHQYVAQQVRLAPVGTRVRFHREEPGEHVGMVVQVPGAGSAGCGGGGSGAGAGDAAGGAAGRSRCMGVLRFVDEQGMPEHLFFDPGDVVGPGAVGVSAQGQGQGQGQESAGSDNVPGETLRRGQLVLFKIQTDLRAQQLVMQQQRMQEQKQQSGPVQGTAAHGAAGAASSRSGPRRAAFQCAVALRPVGRGGGQGGGGGGGLEALTGAQRQAAVLLELLDSTLQVGPRCRGGTRGTPGNNPETMACYLLGAVQSRCMRVRGHWGGAMGYGGLGGAVRLDLGVPVDVGQR